MGVIGVGVVGFIGCGVTIGGPAGVVVIFCRSGTGFICGGVLGIFSSNPMFVIC